MARKLNKLTVKGAAALTTPGRHSDGGGLYLVIDAQGARRWCFLFRWRGKTREMGLGSLNSVPLALAREMAANLRTSVAQGLDPIAARKSKKADLPFGEFAERLIEDLKPEWRNPKTAPQWSQTIKVHASKLAGMRLDEITTDDVVSVLRPIWTKRPETASRLRGRIERVLDAARARGLRSGENPARWRGHLAEVLPKRQKLSRGHHAALPYAKAPDFMEALRARSGISGLALQFVILTAARTGEVRFATWHEIDLKQKLWVIPATRMKSAREHRVPLSADAVAVLKTAKVLASSSSHVFPGHKEGVPISSGSMERVLDRMVVDYTVHGFRSTFSDWASETTETPREIVEAALAHIVGSATERAYRRGDVLERRRRLMDDWALFLRGKEAAL